MAATTATRYTVRKSTVAGWEVVNAEGAVVTVAKNREQARTLAKELPALDAEAAFDAAVVSVLDSGLTGDQLAEVQAQDEVVDAPVWTEEDQAIVEAELAQVAEHDARAVADATAAQERADAEDEVAAEVAAAQQRMAAALAVELAAPVTVAAPKGEQTVARKLEAGQRITLRGVGAVKVTDRVKIEKMKHLVTYTAADGTTGEVELWANSRYRLLAD